MSVPAEHVPQMPIERETLLDPPPAYEGLRETGPVVRMSFPNGRAGWLVTRFEEARAVFAAPRMSARRPRHDVVRDEADSEPKPPPFGPTFVMMDKPEHGRYRRLLAPRFMPADVQS